MNKEEANRLASLRYDLERLRSELEREGIICSHGLQSLEDTRYHIPWDNDEVPSRQITDVVADILNYLGLKYKRTPAKIELVKKDGVIEEEK